MSEPEESKSPKQDRLGPLASLGPPTLHPAPAGRRSPFEAALQALPAHIVVVNGHGQIQIVNDAWLAFARQNDAQNLQTLSIGANYLAVCRAAMEDRSARQALDGIKAVLGGTRSRFTMEYRCDSHERQRWYRMDVAPLESDQQAGAVISHMEITAHKQASEARRANEAWLRALFKNAAVGIGELSADGCWLRSNERAERLTGFTGAQLRGRALSSLILPEDVDALTANLEVMRMAALDAFIIEFRLQRPDGSIVWVSASFSCVRTRHKPPEFLIAILQDISERKLAEARQRTLMLELAHRGKNLLAVVQTVVSRSLMNDRPMPDARRALEGRIQALSGTFGTLTDEIFGGSLLDTVFKSELAPYGARAQLDGPSVVLTLQATQMLTLAVHELATNAAKYGALSVPDGRLTVSWRVVEKDAQQRLQLQWREQDGPPVKPPTRRGFGTTLITRVLSAEFDCVPQLSYDVLGFGYSFDAPLADIGTLRHDSPIRRQLRNEVVRALYDAWQRQFQVHGGLPPLSAFDWTRFALTGSLTMASIDASGLPQFTQIGYALKAQSATPLDPNELSLRGTTTIAQAYQRCACNAEPGHEYLRLDFGDGEPVSFERLLVPFSATGNGVVTHVIGVSIFNGDTSAPARALPR